MEYKNVLIQELDHFGRGIAKLKEKVVFVENALPREVVDIFVYKIHKNYEEAKVIKYIKTSSDRREVLCPYYNECGGCNIMHLKYQKQVDFKKNKLKNIFKKYLNLDIDLEFVESNNEFNYRNKITLHKKDNKYGFYKKESNDIIKIDNCLIASNKINQELKKKHEFEDQLVFRTSDNDLISSLSDKELLKQINQYQFKLNINSFFQVNDYICGCIFNELEKQIDKDSNVLDLYSGVGTLGIVSSKKAKQVYSIEVNKNAVKNNIESLEINNIKNVKVFSGKVENILKDFKEKIDQVILDPPRSGLDKFTLNYLKQSKINKIIYISCDPMSLVRDIKQLDNYKIEKIKLFDMFPNTYHVECICVMNRH